MGSLLKKSLIFCRISSIDALIFTYARSSLSITCVLGMPRRQMTETGVLSGILSHCSLLPLKYMIFKFSGFSVSLPSVPSNEVGRLKISKLDYKIFVLIDITPSGTLYLVSLLPLG